MSLSEGFSKFGTIGLDAIPGQPLNGSPKNSSVMVFPRELREERKDFPCISFSAENQFVFLPIPPGLTFSDNIAYNTINLGILGPTVVDAMRQFGNTMGASVDDMQVQAGLNLQNIYDGIKNRVMQGNAAAATSILARAPVISQYADKIDYAQKQILSPNTNTSFESPGVRSFSFTFRMVSKDKGDTEAMKNIVSFFRKYAYPEGNTVLMKYPPVWTIKFFNGTERNSYIPGIYGCYLTGLSTTYNNNTNIFHADGSPIEIDIGLNFQETKALTRAEIEKLNTGEGEI